MYICKYRGREGEEEGEEREDREEKRLSEQIHIRRAAEALPLQLRKICEKEIRFKQEEMKRYAIDTRTRALVDFL